MYEKIITHNDFDGLASAAICSYIFKIDQIQFAGPNTITNSQITITEADIVCDLPYPLMCGLWFDHHEGNFEELKYRKINAADIPGKFDLQPSCARVCYDYFSEKSLLPDYFNALVSEADTIDSFNFTSIEDWRRETPGKIIDAAIRSNFYPDIQEKRQKMREWIFLLRDKPIAKVALAPSIQASFKHYQQEEQEMLNLIEANATFPSDKNKEIIILDFTRFNRQPRITKNLAYLIYPDAAAVLEINSIFRRNIKTNNFGVSMALSLNLNSQDHHKDVGEIMRILNIGDGHAGAAGGTVYCNSKNEMLKQKQYIVDRIIQIWEDQ
jgi:oligoribonuclease NrnB/cAMP/cGMP phosphodiesterase (DHH superfamily)